MSALRRTLAVTTRVFLALKHDKRSLAPMLVGPILMMTVFGFAFGSEVGDVPVGVVNDDAGDLARDVLDHVDPAALRLRSYATGAAARAAVDAGEVRAALLFPPGFTADATPTPPGEPACVGIPPVQQCQPGTPPAPPRGTNLTIVLDGSNSQIAQAVLREVAEALQRTAEDQGNAPPVQVQTQYAFAEGATFLDFFVPGILVFAALMFTTLLTLLAFVGERTTGTMQRLLASPIRVGEIVAGYALAFGVLAAVQGAVLLAVAITLFDALVVGSVALAFLVVVLMAVDAMSLGILLSAAAQREAQAVQFIPLVILPAFLLSGIFVPVESLPSWLQPFSYVIPPTYAVEALREVMLRGRGIEAIAPELAALAGFGVLFLAAAVAGLRRQRA